MATRFEYFGFEYEVLEDKKNEVALIDAISAEGRTVIPKNVEYNGQKYTVTQITGKSVSYQYIKKAKSWFKKNETISGQKWRGAFQNKGIDEKRSDNWVSWMSNYSSLDVVIPDSVTYIGDNVFDGCNLTSISIPDSVTCIGKETFKFCDKLSHIDIPNSVRSIGKSAFYHCEGLRSIQLPNNIASIEEEVFCGCDGLVSVTIPASVKTIAEYAFWREKEGMGVIIENQEGEVIIAPQAFNTNVKIKYVGKPKNMPTPPKPEPKKEEPKPTPAKPAATCSADGKMTVGQLVADFKAQFGSVLKIYNGRSKADDSLSLQEVGLTGNLSLPFDGNQKVGDFIAQMAQVGLKVKIYTCDEWVACIPELTLTATGKVKKAATKADMEKML